MKRLHTHTLHTLFGLLSSLFIYLAFLSFSNPNKLPIPMLIIPSLLFGVVVYFFVRLAQAAIFDKSTRLTAVLCSLYLVILSLLASLQQLSWRDAVFAGVLLWLFVFYFNRSRK